MSDRAWYRGVCLGAVLLLASACNKGKDDIATVNGNPITKAQFEAYLRYKRIPPEVGKTRDRALDEYLDREAMAAAIDETGKLDKALIEAEINELRKEAVISRHFEKVLEGIVTDQAVRNYYESHAADYEDKKVHVAHILLRLNANSSDEERAAKLSTAREIYSLITAGKDFAELASARSEDQVSGKKGGDLGWITEGAFDPAFSKQAFSIAVGQLSEPFESAFGFHILKVIDAPQSVRRPFEAVAGDIRHRLRAEAKQAEVERLKAMASIERKSGGAGR